MPEMVNEDAGDNQTADGKDEGARRAFTGNDLFAQAQLEFF